jgi:hypothetical protein
MSAWDDTSRLLPSFRSAVLTALDADGYPCSVRCQPRPDAGAQVFLIDPSPGATLQPGPAAVLCHAHDELLAHQRSFVVRGTLATEPEGLVFHPERFSPGLGLGGPLSLVRFSRDARRTAGRYLAARNLPRPRVPWDEIDAVKNEAKRANKAGHQPGTR